MLQLDQGWVELTYHKKSAYHAYRTTLQGRFLFHERFWCNIYSESNDWLFVSAFFLDSTVQKPRFTFCVRACLQRPFDIRNQSYFKLYTMVALHSADPGLDNERNEPLDLTTISPVAELQMVNYKRLAANDINEAEKLFRACQTDGFFYLDLYDPDDQIVLNSVDDVYALARSLFTLDDAEKLIYDVDKLGEMKLNGYIILTAPILLVNSVVSLSADSIPTTLATSLVAVTLVVVPLLSLSRKSRQSENLQVSAVNATASKAMPYALLVYLSTHFS